MRKINQRVRQAFIDKKPFKAGKTQVDKNTRGCMELYYCENKIAWVEPDTVCGKYVGRALFFNCHGWPSKTVLSRINAVLPDNDRLYIKKGVLHYLLGSGKQETKVSRDGTLGITLEKEFI